MLFEYYFPVAQLKLPLFLPPLIGFILSLFCSTVGISGAFLLLPFQVSILNYTTVTVSATNHLYNVVAIPSGVYKYWKEKRFYYPLTILITLGTFPGVVIGYFFRISLFESLKNFKLLVGAVLLFIAGKMIYDLFFPQKQVKFSPEPIRTLRFSLFSLEFKYSEKVYRVNTILVILTALVIGVIGGIYGIGGGALMAPILFAFFHLPPYVFAGATLFGTFLTSVLGVIIFTLGGKGPDFLLGVLFGIGGAFGMYLGAKIQKRVPQKALSILLIFILLFISLKYISDSLLQLRREL